MARITVEDCRHVAPEQYELVLLAGQRARALGVGMAPLVEFDRDKRPIIALREIAAGSPDLDRLREDLIHRRIRPITADELDAPWDTPGDRQPAARNRTLEELQP